MINDFITEFTIELNRLKYTDIDAAATEYTALYHASIAKGSTALEAVLLLGDAKEAARRTCGVEYSVEDKLTNNQLIDGKKAPTGGSKSSVFFGDMFIGIGVLFVSLSTFAVAFLSAIIGVCGGLYAYKSWTDPVLTGWANGGFAFGVAICGIIVCILGFIASVALSRSVFKGVQLHRIARRETLDRIAGIPPKATDDDSQDGGVEAQNMTDATCDTAVNTDITNNTDTPADVTNAVIA